MRAGPGAPCYGVPIMERRNRVRSIPMPPELAARVERSAISLGLSFAERVRLALAREFGIPWAPATGGKPAGPDTVVRMDRDTEARGRASARAIRERWDAMRAGARAVAVSGGACRCPVHAVAGGVHIPGCAHAIARAKRGERGAS